jgi:hypothetical protein
MLDNRQLLINEITTHFAKGEGFQNIVAARKFASGILQQPIESGTIIAKIVEEAIEAGIVRAARSIVTSSITTTEAFDRLVELYDRQPNLRSRSSTSIKEQAYSTPLPVAYLAAILADIQPDLTVYEPSAGHGALLLEANPSQSIVNELNSDRAAELRLQGYEVNIGDATLYSPSQLVDRVIMNPPFGTVIDRNGSKQKWQVTGGNATKQYTTARIDHAIVLRGLAALKDDGKAALIIGAPLSNRTSASGDTEASANTYNGKDMRAFYYSLYQNYNIINHFSIAGNIYGKQGTNFPIDIVVVDGRGKASRRLPAVDVPQVYTTFEQLKELLPNETRQVSRSAIYVDTARRRDDSELRSDSKQQQSTTEGYGAVPDSTGRENRDLNPGSSTLTEATGSREIFRFGTEQPGRIGRTGEVGSIDRVSDSRGDLPDLEPIEIYQSSRDDPEPERLGMVTDSDTTQQPFPRNAGSSDARPLLLRKFSSSTNRANSSYSRRPRSRRNESGRMAKHDGRHLQLTDLEVKIMAETNLKATQALYQAKSLAPSVDQKTATYVPSNLQSSIAKALDDLEARRGPVDEFVMSQLEIVDRDSLYRRFGSEQIDALALAFDNLERNLAFVDGDQTGMGKGRFVAAIIQHTIDQGQIPIFITEKPGLYADIMRDLSGIEARGIRPLVTDNAITIPLPDGSELRTASTSQHTAQIAGYAEAGNIGEYNAIFTTYNQLQTVKNGQTTERRRLLEAIAPNAVLVLDESHNAGGTATDFSAKSFVPNRSDFVRDLISKSAGVVYSSATYAKNTQAMSLYLEKTDMSLFIRNKYELAEVVNSGGIPLQQMFSAALAESGQYIRRERTYEGIEFGSEEVAVDRETAEQIANVMGVILQFDEAKQTALKGLNKEARETASQITGDKSVGSAGAESTNFSSIMHNVVAQTLLAMKADAVADRAIEAIRNGEQVVIALSNTMESAISNAAAGQGLKVGDEIDLSIGDSLQRYLERSRDVVIRDYSGTQTTKRLNDDELGHIAVALYGEAEQIIADFDWSKVPVSPIDRIRQRIENAGFSSDELTGRKERIQYEADGSQTYQVRSDKEVSPSGKIAKQNRFNSGELDVLVINRSAASGISLHALLESARPRRMLIVQPELNIDTFTQMLGRINRTGQKSLPAFTMVMADIPAERRPAAVLSNKMAALNANTTAARTGNTSFNQTTDFLNDYGDRAATQVMIDNPKLNDRLGRPVKGVIDDDADIEKIDTTKAMSRVTGRAAALPIAQQEKLYEMLGAEYVSIIDYEKSLGRSPLEAAALNLDAKTLLKKEILPGTGTSPFAQPIYWELVDIKSSSKPLTQLEVINAVRVSLEMEPVSSLEENTPGEVNLAATKQAIITARAIQGQIEIYEQRKTEQETEKIEAADTTGDQDKIDKKIQDSKSKLENRMDKQYQVVNKILRSFPVGSSVSVFDPEAKRITYGVVESITFKNDVTQGSNPVLPSAWRMKIQLADSTISQMVLPLSRINNGEGSIQINPTDVVIGIKKIPIYELFDIQQDKARQERQILTGNVIRAFADFRSKGGNLVNFTNDKGEIRQGLLMGTDFDIVKDLQEKAVLLPTPEDIKAYLDHCQDHGIGANLVTQDNQFIIQVTTSSMKAIAKDPPGGAGKKYYLNPVLMEAAGDEFVQQNRKNDKKMVMPIKGEKVEAFLAAVHEEGFAIYAENANLAREVLGIELPDVGDVAEQLELLKAASAPHIELPRKVAETAAFLSQLERSLEPQRSDEDVLPILKEVEPQQVIDEVVSEAIEPQMVKPAISQREDSPETLEEQQLYVAEEIQSPAAEQAIEAVGSTSTNSERPIREVMQEWRQNAEISGRSDKWIERIEALTEQIINNPGAKILDSTLKFMQLDQAQADIVCSPSLDRLREYYRDAQALGQPQEVLGNIEALARQQMAQSSDETTVQFQMPRADTLQMLQLNERVALISEIREWASNAEIAGRSDKWLDRISQLMEDVINNPSMKLTTKMLESKEIDQQQADLVLRPTRDRLRQYYADAQVLGQPPTVLDNIKNIASRQMVGATNCSANDKVPGDFVNPAFVMDRNEAIQMNQFRKQVIKLSSQQTTPNQSKSSDYQGR